MSKRLDGQANEIDLTYGIPTKRSDFKKPETGLDHLVQETMVSTFKASPTKPKSNSIMPNSALYSTRPKKAFYPAVSRGNAIPVKQANAMQNFPYNKRLSCFEGAQCELRSKGHYMSTGTLTPKKEEGGGLDSHNKYSTFAGD